MHMFQRRFALTVTVAMVGYLLSLMFVVQPTYALCMAPPEQGTWINIDPNTRSLTRIKVQNVCKDQVHNGVPYPPGPDWYMQVFGRCTPKECDWGKVGGELRRDGYIFSVYNHGFARRYVYAKLSQARPGMLYVYTRTDFTDPGRQDYATKDWFRRN
ncbi:MAG: hypothetical protein CYG59_04050 [Chloroflexi bacterium]|nr:MAG: hypothetical protein CYG59_04050 [Chloroflexota bacterium]